tara:strand:- start:1429 stop:2328 length:900 start_codon:yes stop_codon:yes gene_type:complete
MIVYLDQNKWIELARISNGKQSSERDKKILTEFRTLAKNGVSFPLASTHYIEFSRIKDPERRRRLGSTMWELSKGISLAPYTKIVEWEIESGLEKVGIDVEKTDVNLLGKGIEFAFGVSKEKVRSDFEHEMISRIVLTGCDMFNMDPIYSGIFAKQRINFLNHLEELQVKKKLLPKSQWDDWLYAITMVDIIEPMDRVFCAQGLDKSIFEYRSKEYITRFLNAMPTRILDVHLHRQVLKNDQYRPKETDLEDWGGIGVASCYCDVVVCEKHFANMLGRDKYKPTARIVTRLDDVIECAV